MNITKEADYAVRVIYHLSLADKDEIISASTISESQKIPSQFLLKILRKLRKADLIKSFMGVNGGYQLNRNPSEINLKDVIESIDGPIYLNRCLYNPEECNKRATEFCPMHSYLSEVENNLLNDLQDITFDKIVERGL